MKFTWKKVFGSLTGSYEPPVKPCPICCVNCTPACDGYPNCNFSAGCVCGGDGIAVYGAGPNICYCCKEVNTTICTEDCPFCDCPPEGACPCLGCQDIWCDSWSSIWCTDCVWTSSFTPPIGNPGGANSCNIVSTNKPYTYRVDLHGIYGGYTGFSNRILNGPSYGCPTGAACGDGDSMLGGCDPDNARPYIRRYHKSPVQASVGGITGFGVDYACLSWTSDKKTRVMAISGRNVYRYSGFLSGGDTASNWGTQDQTHQCTSDAYVTRYYPWIKNGGLTTWVDPNAFYNPIGISGIAEMETLLGRQFPLSDSVSGLPLWGQPLAGSFNQGNGGGDPTCGATHACYGCECLTASNGTIGHYDARGYTGSQVCFNPQAYVHAYGTYWSRPQQEYTPSGVPLCSVWSFATAMFHFAIHQVYVQGEFAALSLDFTPGANWITEVNTWFDNGSLPAKTVPWRLVNAYRDFLASTPHQILEGWDGGTYYGNAVSWHLEHLAGRINDAGGGVFRVHMPSVFLWDQTPYDSASAGDKYKHMYIIGNANILFDSTCAFPSGLTNGRDVSNSAYSLPYYETRQPSIADIDTHVWATDDVRYHILRFDEVNHDNSGARPGVTANSARIIVFPGCSGQTAEFDVGIKKLPAVAVHGDLCVTTPTVNCPIYQIEDASDSPNEIPPMECACAICANLDNPITYDWDPNNTTQQALPACYANPFMWDSDPADNQYFPHPYLITNPTNNKKDCRYFGPLGYLTGLGYFSATPCRGYNMREEIP